MEHRQLPSPYMTYLQAEWQAFAVDGRRARACREAVAALQPQRVLDVGCGAGQELLPLLELGAFGVGLDAHPEAGAAAGRMLAERGVPASGVGLVRGRAEALPFSARTFDVIVCRLVLPYTDNPAALAELARVLRPGGVLLLKVHHLRYYLRQLRRALPAGDPRSALHALRTLAAGALYHLARQPVPTRLLGKETFQTRWLLQRELGRLGLTVAGELPDSNPATPSLIVRHAQAGAEDTGSAL